MAGNCVICKGELAGPVCLSCLAELQEQMADTARLIALLSSTVLRLSKRLVKMERGQTVEPHRVTTWRN